MITDILLIATILTFITDISGVVKHIETAICKWLEIRKCSITLLNCSLCQTWWVGLFYLIRTGQFTLEGIAVVAVVSFLTTTIQSALWTVKDLCDAVIGWLDKNINRIK